MASTYSNLKIELIGTGEQSGTWGTTTNTNLGTALEEAIVGSADVTFASADVTLSLTNSNATQTARNLRLYLTGTVSAAQNLIVPAIEKLYIVTNSLGYAITIKNSTGTGVAVPAGKTMIVYNDATNIANVTAYFTGDVAITSGTINGTVIGGSSAAAGTFSTLTASGNTTLGTSSGDTITLNAATASIPNNLNFNGTGTVRLPNGTTAQRPGTPTAGMIRYNTSNNEFEGYNGTAWGAIGGGNATNIGFWQNVQTITGNQSISSGYNASSVGPITIAAGASVTVPLGSIWLVL